MNNVQNLYSQGSSQSNGHIIQLVNADNLNSIRSETNTGIFEWND